MSDHRYQWRTAAIHGGLALSCLLVFCYNVVTGRTDLLTGFALTGITNAWIAWEKADLMRRGKA